MKPAIINVKGIRINMNNVKMYGEDATETLDYINISFVDGSNLTIPADSHDDLLETLDLMDRQCGNL